MLYDCMLNTVFECVSLANVILHMAGDSLMKYIVLEKDAVR